MFCSLRLIALNVLQPDVFASCMNISDMKLTPHGVCVLWEWEWIEDMELFEPSIGSDEDSDHDSQIETTSTDSEIPPSGSIPIPHTITFKCIGATRSTDSQTALKKVSQLHAEGYEVPINIFCEPENPFDSRAIAFRCQFADKWHTIGHIVREALDPVYVAIQNRHIISVKFSWVSYLVSWSHSGPGYYAGIDITVQGRWPREVVKCASSR